MERRLSAEITLIFQGAIFYRKFIRQSLQTFADNLQLRNGAMKRPPQANQCQLSAATSRSATSEVAVPRGHSFIVGLI